MNAREQVLDAARQHGWRVHQQPLDGWVGEHEFRRTYSVVIEGTRRQRTEYLSVFFDVCDRLKRAEYEPAQGAHACGVSGRYSRDKLAWTLTKIQTERG